MLHVKNSIQNGGFLCHILKLRFKVDLGKNKNSKWRILLYNEIMFNGKKIN